jgi:hypothetical protein
MGRPTLDKHSNWWVDCLISALARKWHRLKTTYSHNNVGFSTRVDVGLDVMMELPGFL